MVLDRHSKLRIPFLRNIFPVLSYINRFHRDSITGMKLTEVLFGMEVTCRRPVLWPGAGTAVANSVKDVVFWDPYTECQ